MPYEEIKNIEFIGDGSLGEVYKGTFNGRKIALKRFLLKEKTDNYHLFVLDHVNLIKFLLVTYIYFSSYQILQSIFIPSGEKKNLNFVNMLWLFETFKTEPYIYKKADAFCETSLQ